MAAAEPTAAAAVQGRDAPFLRSSGLPFLTVAITMLPQVAPGILLRRPLIPLTEMMYKFFAPVLSAQFITEPVHRPRVVRNLLPMEPARPTQGKPEPAQRLAPTQFPSVLGRRAGTHRASTWLLLTKVREPAEGGSGRGQPASCRGLQLCVAKNDGALTSCEPFSPNGIRFYLRNSHCSILGAFQKEEVVLHLR